MDQALAVERRLVPGLDGSTPESRLLDAMVAHPILTERPFAFSSRGVRLCGPAEVVSGILPPSADGA